MDNENTQSNIVQEKKQEIQNTNEIDTLIEKANKKELVDSSVYNTIKSNAKLFMGEFVNLQMRNMVDNANRMNSLQNQLMSTLDYDDPETMIKAIDMYRKCQETNINLMDKIINDSSDANIVYNDNRQVNTTNNNDIKIDLSNQSKEKLRNITNQIMEIIQNDTEPKE